MAMRSSPPCPQAAATRRAAEAELRDLIAAHAAPHRRLIGAARKWLQKRLPGAHEIVYEYGDAFVISYSPTEHGYEGVVALRASASGVGLWFTRGKELPDPEKLLRGSGKQTRSIHLEGASTLAHPGIARLIDAAVERSPVPIARAGRGAVLIRSTAARQRRTRVQPAAPGHRSSGDSGRRPRPRPRKEKTT